jgi:hypothetical protein
MFDQTRLAFAGWACVASGVVLAGAGLFADRWGSGALDPQATRLALQFALVCAGGLASGAHALGALLPQRWRRTRAYLIYAGLAVWVIGGLFTTGQPDMLQLSVLFGGALQSAGLLGLGIAALRAGVLHDWLRFVPLVAGAWFLAALALRLALFASVGSQLSPALLIGGWGLWWAVLGLVVLARARAPLEE